MKERARVSIFLELTARVGGGTVSTRFVMNQPGCEVKYGDKESGREKGLEI